MKWLLNLLALGVVMTVAELKHDSKAQKKKIDDYEKELGKVVSEVRKEIADLKGELI